MKSWMIAASLLSLPLAAVARAPAVDGIQVSLSQVDPTLTCAQAGARTQVNFDAAAAAFKPRHVVVLLNGVLAPVDRVHSAWPKVTLNGGLTAGRNTIELVVQRADGTAVRRSIVVKVGNSVQSSDGVTLGCSGPENESTAVVQDSVVSETPTTVVYGVPSPVYAPLPVYYGGYYGSYYGGGYGYGWPGYYWGPSLSIGVGTYWGGGHWRGGYRHRGWGGGHWRHR
ncbi:MAG: hypothetical protein EPN72_03930 [Nevskiaceae bacterium]|nr:MAG: hypothetical protein EPN63_06710 [Nevskiaceae bacterium]TBR73970.1 MAG: hypothetical protein EPN72_03930 [Nevskiaceae bacterium]